MESHVNVFALYSGRNDISPESIKKSIYQPSLFVIPKEYHNNIEPII